MQAVESAPHASTAAGSVEAAALAARGAAAKAKQRERKRDRVSVPRKREYSEYPAWGGSQSTAREYSECAVCTWPCEYSDGASPMSGDLNTARSIRQRHDSYERKTAKYSGH
jgi:hypothetical protein